MMTRADAPEKGVLDTQILSADETARAADMLKAGGLVAIPTETVYGLAANGLDGQAVAHIFAAKGRPTDNPLILHIADMDMLAALVKDIPPKAKALAEAFWPGPLTMILPKAAVVPDIVSGGLSTVAIRMPNHPVALAIIRQAGVPLAAPSANRSGRPSPTTAGHVLQDLQGRIDAVIDGGACQVGLESTVLSLAEEAPLLYRPGAVTPEMLEAVIGPVEIAKGALTHVAGDLPSPSPGMRYRHYAPKANVVLVTGSTGAYARYVNERKGEGIFALCFLEDLPFLQVPAHAYGSEAEPATLGTGLFAGLRAADGANVTNIYAHGPAATGVGLAVYNRLLRAADFQVVSLFEMD